MQARATAGFDVNEGALHLEVCLHQAVERGFFGTAAWQRAGFAGVAQDGAGRIGGW